MLEWLINHHADIHAHNSRGFEPIHIAILENNLASVKWLLRHGISLRSALVAAAQIGNLNIFTLLYLKFHKLLNNLTQTREDFVSLLESTLYEAAENKNEEIVEFILEEAFTRYNATDLPLTRTGTLLNKLLKTLRNKIEREKQRKTETEEQQVDAENEMGEEEEEETGTESETEEENENLEELYEQEAILTRMRNNLINAAHAQAIDRHVQQMVTRLGLAPEVFPQENPNEAVRNLLAQLPSELSRHILTLALR